MRETFRIYRVILPRHTGTKVYLAEVEVYETPTLLKAADGRSVSDWGCRTQLRKAGATDDGWFRSRSDAIHEGVHRSRQWVLSGRNEVERRERVHVRVQALLTSLRSRTLTPRGEIVR